MGSYRRYLLTLAENGCHLFDSFTLGGRTITMTFKRNPIFQGNWEEFQAQHTLGITDDETCVYSAEKISSTVLSATVEYLKTPKSPRRKRRCKKTNLCLMQNANSCLDNFCCNVKHKLVMLQWRQLQRDVEYARLYLNELFGNASIALLLCNQIREDVYHVANL